MNIARYPLISDQISRPALEVVLGELEHVLGRGVPGAIAEFGCYIGTTSLFIRRLLDERKDARQFHVYDSFEGLPPKTRQDQSAAGIDFKAGELMVSKKQFLEQFQRTHLQPPITHKAWFSDLTEKELPAEIAFAFLDGDFYESILASLGLVWPRLHEQGSIAIDDYQRETLPGVEQAVQEFFRSESVKITKAHNIAVIHR